MANILIADDDPANRSLMEFVLRTQAGHDVRGTDSAAGALQEIQVAEPDLLVLDVVMPGVSGIELCRQLRRGGPLPILLVSGEGSVGNRVSGLRAGADDFLPKPFDPAELVERVGALLRRARRAEAGPGGAVLRAGELRLNLIDRQVWTGARGPIPLTPNECRLLYLMMSQPETVWTRQALLQKLWDVGGGYAGTGTAIESYVTRLRRKLEVNPRKPQYLTTIRGGGYRLQVVPARG
jgi:DNA-binding response OmpR family regulator